MKTSLLAVLILTLQIPSTFAKSLDGAGSSGGGFAVVCRDQNNNIASAELLDLYEARNRYGLSLIRSTGSLEGDFMLGVQNTYHLQGHDDFPIDQSVKKSGLDRFMDNVEFVRSPKKIPSINDIGRTVFIPNNCRAEQVALFIDEHEKVLINEDLWDKLDSLSQAALVSHEEFYFQYRKYNESTSENSRASVAHVYSQNAIPAANDNIKKLSFGTSVPALLKNGEQVLSAFYAEQNDGKLILYITHLFGRPLVTESKAIFNVGNVQFKNSWTPNGNGMRVTSNVTQLTKIKATIISNQSKSWELELTLIPNGPVKLGLYQAGILLEEELIQKL